MKMGRGNIRCFRAKPLSLFEPPRNHSHWSILPRTTDRFAAENAGKSFSRHHTWACSHTYTLHSSLGLVPSRCKCTNPKGWMICGCAPRGLRRLRLIHCTVLCWYDGDETASSPWPISIESMGEKKPIQTHEILLKY